jgi:hypothetical protein
MTAALPTLKKIEASRIDANPFRDLVAQPLVESHWQSFVPSIKSGALNVILNVRKHPTIATRYQQVWGHHRLAAHRKVYGVDGLVIIAIVDHDDHDMKLGMLRENWCQNNNIGGHRIHDIKNALRDIAAFVFKTDDFDATSDTSGTDDQTYRQLFESKRAFETTRGLLAKPGSDQAGRELVVKYFNLIAPGAVTERFVRDVLTELKLSNEVAAIISTAKSECGYAEVVEKRISARAKANEVKRDPKEAKSIREATLKAKRNAEKAATIEPVTFDKSIDARLPNDAMRLEFRQQVRALGITCDATQSIHCTMCIQHCDRRSANTSAGVRAYFESTKPRQLPAPTVSVVAHLPTTDVSSNDKGFTRRQNRPADKISDIPSDDPDRVLVTFTLAPETAADLQALMGSSRYGADLPVSALLSKMIISETELESSASDRAKIKRARKNGAM